MRVFCLVVKGVTSGGGRCPRRSVLLSPLGNDVLEMLKLSLFLLNEKLLKKTLPFLREKRRTVVKRISSGREDKFNGMRMTRERIFYRTSNRKIQVLLN